MDSVMPGTARIVLRRALQIFLLACSLLCGYAQAQFIVEDPTLIGKTVAEQIKTAERWRDQYSHYRQQLIRLSRLSFQPSPMADTFPERDVNEGVEEACPGPGGIGGAVSDVFRRVAPNPDEDIIGQQRVLCIRMAQAENQRYNEAARLLKRTIQYQREYQNGIEAQRDDVGSSQGDLAANDNEINRFIARMEVAYQYFMARNKAFDTYIDSLRTQHGQLAKRAFDGKKDTGNLIISRLVQAAALKAALSD